MAPLTAALLGVQHPHSDTHLQTLLQLPEVDRVLLWDADATALAHFQTTHADARAEKKIVGAYTDLAALLARPDWPLRSGRCARTRPLRSILPFLPPASI